MEREFGKYELIEQIGTGGMAEVFLAKSFGAEGLEKILVIKRILPEYTENPRFVDMFISEAKIAVDLNHPNIVQIYDFGKVDGNYYLAMEYVDGCDLGELLSASRHSDEPMSIGNAVFTGIEVARGLHYAHSRRDRFGEHLSIVHRDISPQNVLVSRDGSVKIVDFGIAKATSVADDNPNVVKGKFSYMSPEQAKGKDVDERSDLFSVGVVLFEMLCGRPLFRQTTQEETLSLVKSAVVPDIASLNPDIPDQLEGVLYQLLERDPDDRYQSARELQVALTKVLYGLGDIFDSMTLSAHVKVLEPYLTGELEGDDDRTSAVESTHTTMASRIKTEALQTVTGGTTAQPNTPVTRIADSMPAPMEIHSRERKEIVIVSGELVGLFDLRNSVGQDKWLQVLQEYTRIVDSIAFKNDAVVHRVNEDGFVMLFGIPVSSENDAAIAVRVAMDLHEAISGMNPSLDYPIQLSVGIAIGEVILEQEVDKTGRRFNWSFHGNANQLADRMAQTAMPNEVLLGGQVYRRIRREYKCETVDRVHMPGEEGEEIDIQAYLLVGPKSGREQIDELQRSYHQFYGREIPLKTLREAYREMILERTARAFLITGRQGIGKSTLVEEFLRGLDPRNVRVVRGVVPPYLRDVPLGSIAEMLSEVLRLGQRDDLRQVRDTLSTRIRALFPDEDDTERTLLLESTGAVFNIKFPGGQFAELSGDERKDRIFMSLRKLLVRFAEKKPMVMAMDDAHNIDSMTLEFAQMFLNSTQPAPALLLLTAQESGAHAQTREWKEFLDAKYVESSELGELGESDAADLVHNRLRKHRIDDAELEGEILRRSGGNPLYIKEVVEVLRDRGMLKDSGERRQVKVDKENPQWLPSNVDGLISSRIDRLPLHLKVVLQKVAFLWSPFSGSDIKLVLPDEPFDQLEELVERGFLLRADAPSGAQHETYDPLQTPPEDRLYRFCNALTQDVAARGLIPEEATQLHRTLADYLQARAGEEKVAASALIAHHYDSAGEQERSVEFYFQAADNALDQFGASESLRLCEKVLERVEPGSPYRFRALKIQARALNELGLRDDCRETLDQIEELAAESGDPSELADVYLRKARFFFDQSELRTAREYAEKAADLAEENDDRINLAKTWLTEAMILLNEGARDEALALAERAGEEFSDAEDDDEEAEVGQVRALNLVGVIHRQAGRHTRALEVYEEALERAVAMDLRRWRRYLLTNLGLALAYVGKFNEALDRYNEALAQVKRLGHRREEANLLVNVGHCHMLRGDVDEAISDVRRGNYLARKTNATHVLADGLITLGACYVEEGEAEKAERTLHEGLRLADSIPNVYLSVHATLLLAQANLAAGTSESARIALMQAEDAVERAEGSQMRWGVGYGSMLMARAKKILGRRDEAIELSQKAVDLVDEGEIFSIEEVLYHHFQILPDEDDYEQDRRQAITRAKEVVLYRRDLIPGEDDRNLYMSKSLNRQILNVAKLLE